MIQTWVADIKTLYDETIYSRYYQEVPLYRREKADRIKSRKNRAQSIGAWILYEMAKRESRADDGAVFNLSHSGELVLCSLEDSGDEAVKVGCDIEEIKTMRARIAEKYFLASEKNDIFAQPTKARQTEEFYRYWVLKESFMKATRYGMKLGLDTFEIVCEEGKQPRLIKQPDKIKGNYYFREYQLKQPYKIAVCSTDNVFSEKIKEVNLNTYWG